jgi:glycosyltransferase involved in cell wall biosynthesis
MRIVIPCYWVKKGRIGGGEHLLYSLVRGLACEGNDLTLKCSSETDLAEEFRAALVEYPNVRIVEGGIAGPRFLSEQWQCFGSCAEADVTLFPNYFTPPVLTRRMGKVVTIICDMHYRHLPDTFRFRKRLWLRGAHYVTLRRADRIVVISHEVYRDFVRVYGAKYAQKLAVIYVPVSWERFGNLQETNHPFEGSPYLLCVAAHYPHKNLDTLVRAFATLKQQMSGIKLVMVGQLASRLAGDDHFRSTLGQLIKELGIAADVVVTGYVPENELGMWYRHASAFVYPSLFEGFGIPPVEALGLGLTTVTTSRPPLPEVTLGRCLYVDRPRNVDEWVSTLGEVVRNPEKYRVSEETQQLIRAKYSIRTIARQYVALCNS